MSKLSAINAEYKVFSAKVQDKAGKVGKQVYGALKQGLSYTKNLSQDVVEFTSANKKKIAIGASLTVLLGTVCAMLGYKAHNGDIQS